MFINQDGALTEEASGLAIAKGMPRYMQIRPPFLFWLDDPSKLPVGYPVFMACVEEEHCSDPGDIEKRLKEAKKRARGGNSPLHKLRQHLTG